MSRLFSPITLGNLELRNRVVIPPMCQYMAASDGLPAPWHHMHYGALAISGADLIIQEATGVDAIGRISPNCLGIYTDAQEAALTDMLAGIRSFSSARFGIQLAHAGRKASCEPFDSYVYVPPEKGGWHPLGPSAAKHGDSWPLPRVATQDDLREVIEGFAEAARRADRAGYDLIELHGAHGYLISSFLSPLANRRTDAYGGPLENRMRLAVEIARAVRKAWPAQKALGMRLNGTDWLEGGITIAETAQVAARLKEEGFDYVALSSGGNARGQKLPPIVPGYQAPLAQEVRATAGIATMAVGMVLTPHQAEDILAEGKADLVAIGRAALDDPRWGLHAAQALGDEAVYPRSYWRAAGRVWPGYAMLRSAPVA